MEREGEGRERQGDRGGEREGGGERQRERGREAEREGERERGEKERERETERDRERQREREARKWDAGEGREEGVVLLTQTPSRFTNPHLQCAHSDRRPRTSVQRSLSTVQSATRAQGQSNHHSAYQDV